MIYSSIKKMFQYGVEKDLIDTVDKTYIINNIDSFQHISFPEHPSPPDDSHFAFLGLFPVYLISTHHKISDTILQQMSPPQSPIPFLKKQSWEAFHYTEYVYNPP